MMRLRWLVFIGALIVETIIAFLLRDVVYRAIIVPLAYLFWVLRFYYSFIPQLFLWVLLLIALLVLMIWGLVPETRIARRNEEKRRLTHGQVETLAVWMTKAKYGNYFKWQIARRLGRIARGSREMSGQGSRLASANDAVEKYLDAGLNSSFADYPRPKYPFQRPAPTPLDLDPKKAVEYLESQTELNRGRHS